MAKRFSKYFGKNKKSSILLAGPDGMRSGKAQSSWKEDVRTSVGKNAEQKIRNIKKCDRR